LEKLYDTTFGIDASQEKEKINLEIF
jgi:hypothetical protein